MNPEASGRYGNQRSRSYTNAFHVTLTDVFIRRPSQTKSLSDTELMRHVQKGDGAAFRVLYDRYKAQLFIYCLRMMNDRDAAKDVLTIAEYHRLRNHLEDKVINVRRPAAEFADKVLN